MSPIAWDNFMFQFLSARVSGNCVIREHFLLLAPTFFVRSKIRLGGCEIPLRPFALPNTAQSGSSQRACVYAQRAQG